MNTHRLIPSRRLRRLPLRLEVFEDRAVPSASIPLSETNWTSLGPAPLVGGQTPGGFPVSGRTSSVAAHPTNPDILYVGAAGGGVWKTTNATAANPNWTPLTEGQETPYIGAIALAPSNPNIIYVGTGESSWSQLSYYGKGVLKSTDGGANWTLLGTSSFNRVTISTVVVHPTDPDIVFVATGSPGVHGNASAPMGIYRSTDGGVNWTIISHWITLTDGFSDLEVDPTNFSTMYACVGTRLGGSADGVYKTTNALDPAPTWVAVAGLPVGPTVGRTEMAIAPSNTQFMYVSMHNPATAGLFRLFTSTNGGASWTDRTAGVPPLGAMWYGNNVIVEPGNPSNMYLGGSTGLVRSTNGGQNWDSISSGADGRGPHVDHHAFTFDSTGRFITVSDGGAYRYTSATDLWVSLNGINTTRTAGGALDSIQFIGIAIHPTDPDFAIGGTQDNGLDLFSNSVGWSLVEGGDGGDIIVDPFNPERMWRANPVASYGSASYVRRSTDRGSNWVSITNGIVNASASAFYCPMAADPGTPNRIFHGTNVLNVSTDGGDFWGTLLGDTTTFADPIRAIALGPTSASTIYISTGASAIATPGASNSTKVFVTTDNGVTWTERTPQAGGDFMNIVVDPTNANIAYVISAQFSPTGDNIWKTTNAGVSWTSLSANLPDGPFFDVVLDPGATPSNSDDILYVGGDLGVYRSTDLGANWAKLGAGLPASQVRDLEYSPVTKILAAGTHGRGVWEILTGTPTTPGVIAGTTYNDLNGNGVREGGEPGLVGWTVFRDDDNDGVIDIVGTSTISSTDVPLIINDEKTQSSTLTVSGKSGAIADVNVKFDLTHTFDGDLQAFLTSPAGTKVTLFANVGWDGQGFSDTVLDDEAGLIISAGSAPFTAAFQPLGMLAALDGQNPNGTWTLTIADVLGGDSGTLNDWSLTLTTGEANTTTATAGQYQFLNQPTGTYNIRRVLQAGWTGTAPIGGVQVVNLTPAQGEFNRDFGQTNVPAKVASVVVNNGDAQRSRVTQAKVVFDSIVNFAGAPEAAFKLVRTGPGAPSGEPAGVVTLAAAVTNAGHTEVTLTFSGPVTEFGSLMDGDYTLTVLASQFAGAGFDGNGNGTAGDNFSTATGVIHRYFGDIDGDRDNDAMDFLMFRNTSGLNSGDPGFIAGFDFNGDGDVDSADFLEYRTRFGSGI